ncbi:alcohol oxidase [Leptodontidium sp. 2 PMI_412]|nr:alcohol oxidase [Leptodontidium sp. 2 PMI_412]
MESVAPLMVDIIVTGGGASGGVVAGRLAKAHPHLSVLLIEAGSDNRDNPNVTFPSLFVTNLDPSFKIHKFYDSKMRTVLGNRPIPVMASHILGGGSSINFMMYSRPLASDFDGWNTEGWSGADMLPLFKSLENYCEGEDGLNRETHGDSGPMKVSHGGGFTRYKIEVAKWMNAVVRAGLPVAEDIQDFKTPNGVAPIASWVDGKTGKRSDTAHCLIHPLLDAGNTGLKVLLNSPVNRVLFDSRKRAIGVELGSSAIILARKQIILSSGTLGSSQTLERSGVGCEKRLRELHIPCIANNKGVGESYIDHQFVLISYKSKASQNDTHDALWQGRVSIQEVIERGDGIAGWNGCIISGKISPTPKELEAMGAEFQQVFKEDYQNPEKPLAFFTGSSSLGGSHLATAAPRQYFTFAIATSYGRSRGYIHAQGNSLVNVPEFDAGFFSDESDMKILAWVYKKTREIARRLDDYDGGFPLTHPNFDTTSPANMEVDDAYLKSLGDDKSKIEDLVYTKADNDALEDFLKTTVGTMWHSAGTCAMKPLERGGVVDKNLNVYGVEGLKIADLSIMPQMVAGNTYSSALVIGEKAAQIVTREIAANEKGRDTRLWNGGSVLARL